MRAGIRRIAMLAAVVWGVTVAVSALLGLAAGGDVAMAVATGCYLVGALLVVAGVLAGIRGPLRTEAKGDSGAPVSFFGFGLTRRRLRRATDDEQHATVVLAALFVALGVVLVMFGIAADSTVELV